MGRPKGALGNPFGVRKERWNPVKWRIDHEAVVLLHVSGKSAQEIADIHQKSVMWVSLVINSPKAQEVIEKIRNRLPIEDTGERYSRILDKAVKRMEDFLDDDRINSSPFMAVQAAMRMAEMIDGKLKRRIEGETNNITNNTVVLASEANVDRLLGALEKSQKVTEMHRKGAIQGEIKLLKDGTDG